MKTSNLLNILLKINSLLGENQWNLEGVDARNFRRWFSSDATTQPSCHAAKRVALSVWRRISQPGEQELRKDVFAAIRGVVPDAPCDSWTEETFAAWFFDLAEVEREKGDRAQVGTTWDIHFDVSVRHELSNAYVPVSTVGALPLCIHDEVRILHQVSPTAFIYLVWLQSGGQLKKLRSWHPNSATQAGKVRAGVEFSLPALSEPTRLRVRGPAGVETMIIAANPTIVEDSMWNHAQVALSSRRFQKKLQFNDARHFEFARSNSNPGIKVHNVEIIESDEIDEFHSTLWAVLNPLVTLVQGVSFCNTGRRRSAAPATIRRTKPQSDQQISL